MLNALLLAKVIVGVDHAYVERRACPRSTELASFTLSYAPRIAGVSGLLGQLVPLAHSLPCLIGEFTFEEVKPAVEFHGANFPVTEQEDTSVFLGHVAAEALAVILGLVSFAHTHRLTRHTLHRN